MQAARLTAQIKPHAEARGFGDSARFAAGSWLPYLSCTATGLPQGIDLQPGSCKTSGQLDMESLLNLVWFMMALLALGLWWRKTGPMRNMCRLSRVDQLVLLACILILLFPVVSATDDLHPLRQEMEESGPSKRLKQGVTEKCSSNLSFAHTSALYLIRFSSIVPLKQISREIVLGRTLCPANHHPSTEGCRAPPASALS